MAVGGVLKGTPDEGTRYKFNLEEGIDDDNIQLKLIRKQISEWK